MACVLFIIKLIGIIILILFALILLIAASVLFVPVRYDTELKLMDAVPEGRFELRWMLGLLRFKAAFRYKESPEAYVSLLGHKIYDLLDDRKADDNSVSGKSGKSAAAEGKDQGTDLMSKPQDEFKTVKADVQADDAYHMCEAQADEPFIKDNAHSGETYYWDDRSVSEAKADTEDVCKADRKTVYIKQGEAESGAADNHKAILEEDTDAAEKKTGILTFGNPLRLLKDKLGAAADRLTESLDKAEAAMKEKIAILLDTVRALYRACRKKSEQLKALYSLWNDEKYSKAVGLLKSRTIRLLKELRPRKGSGFFRFGSGDPYTTAGVMQAAVFFYSLCGDTVEIIPDFDKAACELELKIKGRIRIVIPAEAALRIWFNKSLRIMYKKARYILKADD